ncbi:DUF4136 domain-containing protein [Kordia sp. TARA_039_SRF]|jgi:hypothetical protein|nr:DUF4136 domain-containing protein [Kordia sp. TARA_039_SRF]
MKKLKVLFPIVALLLITSCISVRVVADYDQEADFKTYKTFAFYKTGIDQAEISDLDKKRILRSIENEMVAKGFVKSDNPDLLVNIMTKANKRVDLNNNWGWGFGGWGWGWNPWIWGGGGMQTVRTRVEGVLYIDLIDTKQKELVWQGRGAGNLLNTSNIEKKEARIQEFVKEIMKEYPPMADTQ